MAAEMISFARGAPCADILPSRPCGRPRRGRLSRDWERALSYGKGEGHPGLASGSPSATSIEPAQVMVTNGSLEAGAMLFEHLLEPGDRVVVEQPSYDRTLLLIGRLGVEMVACRSRTTASTSPGWSARWRPGPVKLVHLIPNFHNPAGCTLSAEKRERVLELAAEHGFWIFEDDPYRELPSSSEPPPTMLSLPTAAGGSSMPPRSRRRSAPGVRVGYLAGPEEEIAKLVKRANEIYISPNMLAESIVWELCRSGALETNIEFVRGALQERRDALVDGAGGEAARGRVRRARRRLLPLADLRERTSTAPTCWPRATRSRSASSPAPTSCSRAASSLRLSFARVPAEQIGEGVERIAAALERVRAASPA